MLKCPASDPCFRQGRFEISGKLEGLGPGTLFRRVRIESLGDPEMRILSSSAIETHLAGSQLTQSGPQSGVQTESSKFRDPLPCLAYVVLDLVVPRGPAPGSLRVALTFPSGARHDQSPVRSENS